MKTWQLVFLRLYMVTFGRVAFFAALLRRALVLGLIRGRTKDPYHASSKFFCMKEIVSIPEEERKGAA